MEPFLSKFGGHSSCLRIVFSRSSCSSVMLSLSNLSNLSARGLLVPLRSLRSSLHSHAFFDGSCRTSISSKTARHAIGGLTNVLTCINEFSSNVFSASSAAEIERCSNEFVELNRQEKRVLLKIAYLKTCCSSK